MATKPKAKAKSPAKNATTTKKAKVKAPPKTKAKAQKPAAKKTAPKAKAPSKPKTKTKAQAKAKVKKVATKKAASKKKLMTSARRTAPASTVDSQFRNFTPYEPKKGEYYMNDEQLEHFRQILNNWRRELMEEVDRTVLHMQDEAANFPDPADRATQEEEFSIELRTRDRERKLIKKIDQTIDRVDQEDYGYCDTCGIEIGLRRLEARPTATQCVDCKALDEIKERQIHG